MGALARLIAFLWKNKWALGGSFAAGYAGQKAADATDDVSEAGSKFTRIVPPVAIGGATVWFMDRMLDKRAFGGGTARQGALLGLGAGVAWWTYKSRAPEAPAQAGLNGLAELDLGNV